VPSTLSSFCAASKEFEWLFDYIVEFLKSPPWVVPLNKFIDENCITFDNEEENKFAYTECHEVRSPLFCDVHSVLSRWMMSFAEILPIGR
jgi:hypothetical protein